MSEQAEIAAVNKNGVTPIEISLRRTGVGLEVNVKVSPDVEDFMKQLGGGEQLRVDHYGRNWVPRGPKGTILYAYNLIEAINPSQNMYRIEALGMPLTYDGYTNLSFLRLVGASEGVGAGFFVKSVYSVGALREMKDHISVAARQFFVDYLRPIDMIVKVSTQEVRL